MTAQPAAPSRDARSLAADLQRAYRSPPVLSAEPNRLADALRSETVRAFGSHGPLAACLFPLLDALKWRGTPRDLIEALPHQTGDLELTDALNVLASLGYACRGIKVSGGRFEERLLPALLVQPSGDPLVLLRRGRDGWRAYCPATDSERDVPAAQISGELHCPARARSSDDGHEQARHENWMGHLIRRFRGAAWQLFAITAVLNIFVLATSFYMLAIYDKVIPTRNHMTLLMLAIGIVALMLIDAALRKTRARIIAHVGARIETVAGTATFKQLIDLPPPSLEGAPVGSQVSRLREFDSIRELFTGPVVSVALELPFTLLFLAAIWWLAGPVVWVPVVMLALYAVLGLAIDPALKREVRRSSRARAERHAFLIDMFANFAAVKQLSAEKMWLDRFSQISGDTAYSHYQVTRLTQLLQSLAQAIMLAAGIGAVAWSVVRVVDGAMTMGGMIAVMTLIWRLLSPMQSLFLALTRLEQARLSSHQLNQLMRLPTEVRRNGESRRIRRNIVGAVNFDRVSFRYKPSSDPALLGVTFAARPGELIAITGGNGAGKTTLMTLLLAMYRPQGGAILIDGIDIRQSDPLELRQAIAYVPQETALFHGTVAQNLRLGNPLASDAELHEACAKIGVLDTILAFPDGFETHLGDNSQNRHSAGLRQAIAIARALVKQPRILLLDESAQLLDTLNSEAYVQVLQELRGKVTTFIVTHRPSHMALADSLAVMERGQLIAFGKADKIMPAYLQSLQIKGEAA